MNKIIDIKITEGTITEPVSLAEAKKQLLVDHSIDDSSITTLIKQCRQEFETLCNISIVEKTITLISDWNCEQQLPYGPVKSISEVKVKTGVAANGSAEYEVPNMYSIDAGAFNIGCSRLKIIYVAGLDTVTEGLKKALLNLVAFRYENKGDHQTELSQDVLDQLLQFKDYSWY